MNSCVAFNKITRKWAGYLTAIKNVLKKQDFIIKAILIKARHKCCF